MVICYSIFLKFIHMLKATLMNGNITNNAKINGISTAQAAPLMSRLLPTNRTSQTTRYTLCETL